MHRFPHILLTTLLAAGSWLVPALAGGGEKPNVLLIAIDDLNDWVGCLNTHPDTVTPNIDRLAARGTLFSNAHCQAPICNPSRTSIMYGLRPSTTGIYMNRPKPMQVPAMREHTTMPRHFAANGYVTLTCGKIYHGSSLPEGDFDVVGPRPPQMLAYDKRVQTELKTNSRLWDFGPQAYAEEKFLDHISATWAVEQLERDYDKPFFFACGFSRPHVPFYSPTRVFNATPKRPELPQVKDDDRADIPEIAQRITVSSNPPSHTWMVENDKWHEGVRSYLACICWVDEQIGRVLTALDKSPYADNTIVVLYSDHGFHLGEKQRYAKFALWERATKVPFIIAAPGKPRGRVCRRPAELLSIFPTLIELAGIKRRDGLEGRSIVRLLEDAEAKWDPPAITTFGKDNHAFRDQRYRYIRYSDGSEELYDHENDPHEWHNLAGEESLADVKADLSKWTPKVNAAPVKGVPPRKRPASTSRPRRSTAWTKEVSQPRSASLGVGSDPKPQESEQ